MFGFHSSSCSALGAVSAAIHAQITNPIPAPVVKRGLSVEIRDVVRLPETRGLRPADQDVTPAGWARVSFVRDLPDGRRFANDSRGFLYLLDAEQPAVGVRERRPPLPARRLQPAGERVHRIRLPSGVRANGLFYTVHAERAMGNPATPNFIPPGFTPADVTYHNVITEWHATNPAANTFEGTQARAAPRRPHRRQPDAPVRARRVQPDGEARHARLRPALHERQRPRVQQRRRTAREQSRARRSASTR